MPEIEVIVGGRTFEVACQSGEETYLRSAARYLDAEANALSTQIGRVPEPRMLLMAGLMVADKTAGLEERLREAEGRIEKLESRLRSQVPVEVPVEVRVEVPVIPPDLTQLLADLAVEAEALERSVTSLAASSEPGPEVIAAPA